MTFHLMLLSEVARPVRWAACVLLLGTTAGLSCPASAADVAPLEASKTERMRDEVLAMIRKHYVDPVDVGAFSQTDLKTLVREIDPEGEYIDAQRLRELAGPSEKPASLGQAAVTQQQTVRLGELGSDYVHIRISQFLTGTSADLVSQLNERFQQGIPKGLVLDLRNCSGGLLHGAVGIAAVFLPPNVLVATFSGQGQDGNFSVYASPQYYVRREPDSMKGLRPDVKKVPLVVLVDERTAAGAEIVTAALQDHKRAVVVGTRTFGRATVQTVIPLSGQAALKLTTARWVSPQQKSVQGTGLVPDVVSTLRPGETPQDAPYNDNQLEHALTILKAAASNPG